MKCSNKLAFCSLVAGRFPLDLATSDADLGDNYATSCQRYGSPSQIDRQHGFINWNVNETVISEQFRNDQCVAVFDGSYGITEAWLWQLLRNNALPTQYWREYADPNPGRSFLTTDGRIYGKYSILNGLPMLRVPYKTVGSAWVAELQPVPRPS